MVSRRTWINSEDRVEIIESTAKSDGDDINALEDRVDTNEGDVSEIRNQVDNIEVRTTNGQENRHWAWSTSERPKSGTIEVLVRCNYLAIQDKVIQQD